MKEYNIETCYQNEEERLFNEEHSILRVIGNYLDDLKEEDKIINHKKYGELFDYDIAFRLKKMINPPVEYDGMVIQKEWSERITLQSIKIERKEVKLEIPYVKKYTFKERLKILFKGRL